MSDHAAGRVGADTKSDTKKVRLNADVTHDVNQTLVRLTAELGTTKSEALRKAINLLEVAVEAKAKGQYLTVADKDLNVLTRIIGI